MGTDLFRPAGSAAVDGEPVHLTPADAGWSFSGLRVLVARRRAIAACIRARRHRGGGPPALRLVRHRGRQRDVRARGPPRRVLTRVGLRVSPLRNGDGRQDQAGCELALPNAPGDPGAHPRVRARACRGRRGPRRRRRDPPDQQLPRRRRLRSRAPDRRRGPHAGRELVVLPAAQARRAHRGRDPARGDLLLPDPRASTASACTGPTRPTARSTRRSRSATATCS